MSDYSGPSSRAGPLPQACFYALSGQHIFRAKNHRTHLKFARKACCRAWRADFPRLGSIRIPLTTCPSRRYQTFAAQIFTKGVLSRWRGGGFPPSVWAHSSVSTVFLMRPTVSKQHSSELGKRISLEQRANLIGITMCANDGEGAPRLPRAGAERNIPPCRLKRRPPPTGAREDLENRILRTREFKPDEPRRSAATSDEAAGRRKTYNRDLTDPLEKPEGGPPGPPL